MAKTGFELTILLPHPHPQCCLPVYNLSLSGLSPISVPPV